jgi:hypothetical protein
VKQGFTFSFGGFSNNVFVVFDCKALYRLSYTDIMRGLSFVISVPINIQGKLQVNIAWYDLPCKGPKFYQSCQNQGSMVDEVGFFSVCRVSMRVKLRFCVVCGWRYYTERPTVARFHLRSLICLLKFQSLQTGIIFIQENAMVED